MKKIVKNIILKEWFEKRDDKVFCIWELPTGERIERLSPYNELPWVEIKDSFYTEL